MNYSDAQKNVNTKPVARVLSVILFFIYAFNLYGTLTARGAFTPSNIFFSLVNVVAALAIIYSLLRLKKWGLILIAITVLLHVLYFDIVAIVFNSLALGAFWYILKISEGRKTTTSFSPSL